MLCKVFFSADTPKWMERSKEAVEDERVNCCVFERGERTMEGTENDKTINQGGDPMD